MTRVPKFFRRGCVRILPMALLAIACGCQQANYSGMEPSVRTFNDNAAVRDYYVGFDMNFIVEDDAPRFHSPTTRPISQY